MINNKEINEINFSKIKVERSLFNIRNLMIMMRLACQGGDITGDTVDFIISVNGIVTSVEDEINELLQEALPNLS